MRFLARVAPVALLTARGWAQCSMCRTAAAQNPHAADTINTAIFILLLPALILFSAVFLLAFRSAGGASDK
jgi:hypothetical protein